MMLVWAKHALKPWHYPKNVYLTRKGEAKKRDGLCRRCAKVIPLTTWSELGDDGQPVPLEKRTTQNGLDLHLVGGYGEFYDVFTEQPVVCLCHECAHDLMDWVGVDASNFHTHNPDSGQHADHHGPHDPATLTCEAVDSYARGLALQGKLDEAALLIRQHADNEWEDVTHSELAVILREGAAYDNDEQYEARAIAADEWSLAYVKGLLPKPECFLILTYDTGPEDAGLIGPFDSADEATAFRGKYALNAVTAYVDITRIMSRYTTHHMTPEAAAAHFGRDR